MKVTIHGTRVKDLLTVETLTEPDADGDILILSTRGICLGLSRNETMLLAGLVATAIEESV